MLGGIWIRIVAEWFMGRYALMSYMPVHKRSTFDLLLQAQHCDILVICLSNFACPDSGAC